MKYTYFILLVFLCVSLMNCKDKTQSNNNEKSGMIDKQEAGNSHIDERITTFRISGCPDERRDRKDSGEIVINELTGDTLTLRLGHWMNCAWEEGLLENIRFSNDTLNINLDRPHKYVEKDEEGKEIKVYTAAECNCYFFIDLKLIGTGKKPGTILINSKPVKNGYWG